METQERFLRARIATLEAALRKIITREGRYSRDPLAHASNTIDAMAELAQSALDDTWALMPKKGE